MKIEQLKVEISPKKYRKVGDLISQASEKIQKDCNTNHKYECIINDATRKIINLLLEDKKTNQEEQNEKGRHV